VLAPIIYTNGRKNKPPKTVNPASPLRKEAKHINISSSHSYPRVMRQLADKPVVIPAFLSRMKYINRPKRIIK